MNKACIVMLVAAVAVMGCRKPATKATEEEREIVQVAPEPEPVDTPEVEIPKEWKFSFIKDEMTDGAIIMATLQSDNVVDLDYPYDATLGGIMIRYAKKLGGYDAMVYIGSGQIYGSSYNDDNYVLVRFDDDNPIKYWYNEPADGSSNMVFIRKKNDFIVRCKKATSIKVEVPLYQTGRKVFTFTVDEPLVWRTSDES